ncbi:MAG: abortive infection family protein [Rudaea sp.]|uniref:abortive infection family protein n=1 Tax=unclassified Rudaea TaxID=2627037 RepID=UPI0010F5395F|nr:MULTISPECIES: abortive infection family protein [unclassified Rudaea]MBN8884455.1 abortive infection family protein [Rudaea sp.]
MADLTYTERGKLERLFGMGSGYVLNFSNRSFSEFVTESVRRSIYEDVYMRDHSGSKANCLRAFWKVESNPVVGKLLGDLIDFSADVPEFAKDAELTVQCRAIAERLKQGGAIGELDALVGAGDGKDFELLASQVRQAIEGDQPGAALDRLHTFVVRFIRSLCEEQGSAAAKDTALHALFGGYVKKLKEAGHLESEMTSRILKSSISVLEAFNDVRNNQSLAHDNPTLNYDESLLIFNHVAASVRFLRALDTRIKAARAAKSPPDFDDELPF